MKYSELFAKIYQDGAWGDGSGAKPLSGSGSNPSNARTYVDYVQNFIAENHIASVLDIGHGDWEMWKEYAFQDVKYLGIDVAQGLSELIQERFGSDSRQFKQLDVTQADLPSGDLLLIKDVLQHLPNGEVVKVLHQIKKFKFAIVCNDISINGGVYFELKELVQARTRLKFTVRLKNPFYPSNRKNNRSIDAGNCRGIDLEKKPFLRVLKDFKVEAIVDYDGPFRPGIKKRIYLVTSE